MSAEGDCNNMNLYAIAYVEIQKMLHLREFEFSDVCQKSEEQKIKKKKEGMQRQVKRLLRYNWSPMSEELMADSLLGGVE